MPWLFTYRPQEAWRIEYTTGKNNKLVSDGTSSWVIDDGVAIVAGGPGKPLINNKLRSLVQRPMEVIAAAQGDIGGPIRWGDLQVIEDEISNRSAWTIALDHGSLTIDQGSGLALRWSSDEREIVIHDLEIDPHLPPNFFRWSGPADLDRRPGLAYLAENDHDQPAGFMVHWEVYLEGRFVYCEYGPQGAVEEALAWARQRARQIEIRTADNLRYSAGEEPPRGDFLPRWPE